MNMKTRILSGIIMLPLLAILYFGGYVLFAACLLIGIMGVREFYNGFHAMDIRPAFPIAVIAAAALYCIDFFTEDSRWYMLWFFGVVLASLLYLFNNGSHTAFPVFCDIAVHPVQKELYKN